MIQAWHVMTCRDQEKVVRSERIAALKSAALQHCEPAALEEVSPSGTGMKCRALK